MVKHKALKDPKDAIFNHKKHKTKQHPTREANSRSQEAQTDPTQPHKKRKANKETTEVISAKKRKTEEDFQSKLVSQQKRWRRQPWRQYYHAVTADRETRNSHLSPDTFHRWSRFSSLPLDIVFVISTFLSLADLASLASACQSLRRYLLPEQDRREIITHEFISALHNGSNKEDLIKFLDAGADPNEIIRFTDVGPPRHCCFTALELAIYPSLISTEVLVDRPGEPPDIQLVKLLLEYGANPNRRSDIGTTALVWAVEAQSEEAVMHLLDAGANPDVLCGDDFPALSRAVRTSRGTIGVPGIVRLLLDHGADPNIRDKYGQTPLCIAVEESLKHVANDLLDAGANPNVLMKSGISLLCMAVSIGDEMDNDVVSLLLESGCDPNLVDRDGYTAPYRAVRSRHIQHTNELIKYGADPNIATGKMRWTPLHFATNAREILCCSFLCNNGADPNIEDAAGSTPLHIAFRGRDTEIRHLLLQHGADPNAEDCLGLKPGSYHFKRNIRAWKSIVGGDVEHFIMGHMDNSVVDTRLGRINEMRSDVRLLYIL